MARRPQKAPGWVTSAGVLVSLLLAFGGYAAREGEQRAGVRALDQRMDRSEDALRREIAFACRCCR